MQLNTDTLTALLRKMLRIRLFEENLYRMYTERKIPGMSPHLSVGQEAVAAGMCQVLEQRDYLLTTHRGHGHVLAKGADMKKMLAEILGKETGYCKGRGGSMHIADVNLNIVGANGIVGGGLPISVGVALSSVYLEKDAVVASFFGDGASNIGAFHESLNLSSVLKLPVVWICENNQYALSTNIKRTLSAESVSARAKAYKIPGYKLDGNDVLVVYEKAVEAVEYARSGNGPVLIEAETYRWYGHGASDNRSYRTKEEEAEWRERCPIRRFSSYLESEGIADNREIENITAEITKEVEEAVRYAESSPSPSPETVTEYIY